VTPSHCEPAKVLIVIDVFVPAFNWRAGDSQAANSVRFGEVVLQLSDLDLKHHEFVVD